MLRSASHVLGTAEFFISAVGALRQGKEGDDLAEVKSLHLQVDQALGSSVPSPEHTSQFHSF